MAGLNERQRRFVELYTSGPEGVRGNATACYYSAGYHPRNEAAARAAAARLLTNVNVQRGIQRLYRERDARTINELEDWRLHAPRAQRRILLLAAGIIPQSNVGNEQTGTPPAQRRITSQLDLGIAQVMMKANEFIVERAYPHRVYASPDIVEDPLDEIGRLLGIVREDMPSIDELMHDDHHLSLVD